MNKEEFAGVARAFIAAAAAWASGRGWFTEIDPETRGLVVAALTTLAVAGWSVRAKRAAR